METCEQEAELGKEVRVSEIEKELRQLWEQDDARTNASLINLVIYSEERGALARNSELARALTEEHACRVILVEIDRETTEPSLRAWITAHCHLAQGRKSVCCEQIAFHLTGRVTGRFRNTVFAHLASDLPLVFWWQGEFSSTLTDRLADSLDRLIVDSRDWKDTAGSYRRIGQVAAMNPDLVLQDHAWTRAWQFRLGVAGIFDDPVAGASLRGIDTVEITFNRRDRNSALQLLAWLTVQASWEAGELPLEFVREGVVIRAHLVETEGGPPLSSIVMRGDGFECSVVRDPEAPVLRREIRAGHYQVSSVSPCDPETTEKLLGSQLARGGRNTLFRKVMPRFIKILESCS